ncbi:MBL fold metallo-hydrolase [Dorea sp. D27]|uniref:MBL fold metallo-hydrolase n=1 Tax=Dorea sp. D27 TaxID=658665 RepID=UPI000673B276|nr:MBL fold metallo-hydrolase [Dorea sp. D27]KMZ53371.1 metallo-beta-lactamase family protein [Dorea sp. D27]
MEVCSNVHQIRINFHVTDQIERYVYMYLITGRRCCLIDAGVAGCEDSIAEYMRQIGRSPDEIDALFLTHAHPDHIGGASALRQITGCNVYAPEAEREWIEDIGVQFEKRPIPNFYTLAGASVMVDVPVREGSIIRPGEGVTIRVLETSGHSAGSVSYVFEEAGVVFTGDAIPARDDLPILTDISGSMRSIQTLQTLEHIRYCCPAWDQIYEGSGITEALRRSGALLDKLKQCVLRVEVLYPDRTEAEKMEAVKAHMGWSHLATNPLFAATIKACIE